MPFISRANKSTINNGDAEVMGNVSLNRIRIGFFNVTPVRLLLSGNVSDIISVIIKH